MFDATPKTVCDPTGLIRPEHVGQFFFDVTNNVFYQARGRGSQDWRLVTPAELAGSFVLSFVDLLEARHHGQKMSREEATALRAEREGRAAHVLDLARMGEEGVRIADARRWTSYLGVVATQARIKVESGRESTVFFGFCSDPVSQVAPPANAVDGQIVCDDRNAVGFLLDDRAGGAVPICRGCPADPIDVDPRAAHVLMRVEVADGRARFFVADAMVHEAEAQQRAPLRPAITLFRYA